MASSSNWKEMLKNQQADIERLEAMDRELSEQALADQQIGNKSERYLKAEANEGEKAEAMEESGKQSGQSLRH
jgi:hypothetical protein